MNLKLITSLFLASLVFAIGECRVNYNGYQVFRINATQSRAFEALKNLFVRDDLDFWSPPSKIGSTDVLLAPNRVKSFRTFLDALGAPYEVIIDNLESEIQYERLNYLSQEDEETSEMNWAAYQRLTTIHQWMDAQAQLFPETVTIYNAGNSTEGRTIKIMKISNGPTKSNKPAIWLDGGIHAREWISPATVTYIANELIRETAILRNSRLTKYFDFYIDPLMNPDGYEYTQVDRLWRKTRSGPRPVLGGLLGRCSGVDPNRNWDFQWGGKGTSRNPCSQIYHGPEAASEPEVAAIQNFILERKDNIKLFLTFHSYSQILLLPWGYDEIRTDDHDELMAVGLKALQSLEAVHGTKYQAGNTAEVLYAAAGGSHDWAKGAAGIKFAYCYELRDTGKRGFVLPADQIIPSGEETYAAVASMALDMVEYYHLDQPETPLPNPTEALTESGGIGTDDVLYAKVTPYIPSLNKNNLNNQHIH